MRVALVSSAVATKHCWVFAEKVGAMYRNGFSTPDRLLVALTVTNGINQDLLEYPWVSGHFWIQASHINPSPLLPTPAPTPNPIV